MKCKKQARKNPGAELVLMGANPLRMCNSNFSTDEKLELGRLGISWKAIQTPADVRRARKALKKGREARALFKNPSAAMRNPGERTAESAQEIYSGFHADEPDSVDVMDEPHIPAGNYAELGRLVSIQIKPLPSAPDVYVKGYFPQKENVRVLSDGDRKHIYFAAGDQFISDKDLVQFGCGSETICTLGHARQITYVTRKFQDEVPDSARGELVEWVHDFGEENGVFPQLCYDRSCRRILLRGGDYKIQDVGITN